MGEDHYRVHFAWERLNKKRLRPTTVIIHLPVTLSREGAAVELSPQCQTVTLLHRSVSFTITHRRGETIITIGRSVQVSEAISYTFFPRAIAPPEEL